MTDFNVAKLAKDLGLEPHIVRTKLRAAEIEKNEGAYTWPNQKAYDAVLKQLKADKPKSKAEVETKSAKGKVETKDAGKAPEDKGAKGKKGKKKD